MRHPSARWAGFISIDIYTMLLLGSRTANLRQHCTVKGPHCSTVPTFCRSTSTIGAHLALGWKIEITVAIWDEHGRALVAFAFAFAMGLCTNYAQLRLH